MRVYLEDETGGGHVRPEPVTADEPVETGIGPAVGIDRGVFVHDVEEGEVVSLT